MTIEEIENEWEIDGKVDYSELGTEAIRQHSLHFKYWKIYNREYSRLKKFEMDHKVLKLEMDEFLDAGDDEVTRERGWKLPPKGKIKLKTERPQYVAASKEVREFEYKLDMQRQKLEFLKDIIKHITFRTTNIKLAFNYEKFKNGIDFDTDSS